jgi:ADP-ribose pyrophosphatase YjhB (NUDIX family)
MNYMSTSLAIVGAISAVVTTIAACAAYFLVQRQWRSDALHREHIELLKPDVREALRTVFAAQPEEFLERQDIRLLNAAEKVLDMYDLIGHRLMAGAIPREATVDSEWPTVLRIAQRLQLFIDKTREERNSDYKQGFRMLVRAIIGTPRIAEHVKGKFGGESGWPTWNHLPITPVKGFRNSRPCVAVGIVSDDKILLLQRAAEPGMGSWELPGGFLDGDEPPARGAFREVDEETEFAVLVDKPFDIVMGKYVSETANYDTLNICYEAGLDPKKHAEPTPQPTLSDESQNYYWWPLSLPIEGIEESHPLAFPWLKGVIRSIKESHGF